MTVSGLQNPAYQGSYTLQCLIFGTGSSTVTSIFSNTFTITQNYFVTTQNIFPLFRLCNNPTLLVVNIIVLMFLKIIFKFQYLA